MQKKTTLFLKPDYTKNVSQQPTLKNHAVSADAEFHILNYIKTELFHNALLGPFKPMPLEPWCQISPLMTRPKKYLNKKRIIVDLSFIGIELSMSKAEEAYNAFLSLSKDLGLDQL